jgi:hypothetical protein
MKADHFHGDTLWWTQHKTGEPIPKVLSKPCLDAVNAMLALSTDGTVLAWAATASGGAKQMRKFLRLQRLGGSSKWLRRSGATHIEMEHPGKGRLHLGHLTMGLAEKCYIDWTQVRRDIPRTPTLLE